MNCDLCGSEMEKIEQGWKCQKCGHKKAEKSSIYVSPFGSDELRKKGAYL